MQFFRETQVKPNWATEIDGAHPLTDSLVGFLVLAEEQVSSTGYFRDLSGRDVRGGIIGTLLWAGSREGLAVNLATAGNYIQLGDTGVNGGFALPELTGNWSILIRFRRTSVTVGDSTLWSRWVNSAGSRQLMLYFSDTGTANRIQVDVPFVAAIMTSNGVIGDTTTIHEVCLTRLGNVWSLYIDGLLDKAVTSATTQESAGIRASIGYSPPDAGKGLRGHVLRALAYTRALTAWEVYEHWANPYGMLLPPNGAAIEVFGSEAVASVGQPITRRRGGSIALIGAQRIGRGW